MPDGAEWCGDDDGWCRAERIVRVMQHGVELCGVMRVAAELCAVVIDGTSWRWLMRGGAVLYLAMLDDVGRCGVVQVVCCGEIWSRERFRHDVDLCGCLLRGFWWCLVVRDRAEWF